MIALEGVGRVDETVYLLGVLEELFGFKSALGLSVLPMAAIGKILADCFYSFRDGYTFAAQIKMQRLWINQ